MKKIRKENKLIKELIDQYGVKTTDDIKDMLKDLLGETIQTMLEGEIEEDLGYSKYNYDEKNTQNSRNGYSPKKVRSEYGEVELNIPRDRNNEFKPQIIPKYQREITGIEGQIIALYAKGMSNRDIEDHLKNIYGIEVSSTMISKITDKILPEIKEWQTRQLEEVYPIVFMDAIHYSVRQDGIVIKKAVYNTDRNKFKRRKGLDRRKRKQ